MIYGKDKKWHHKKTIKMWEEIAKKNLDDKMDTKLCQKHSPYLDCFLCEWYSPADPDCGECPMFKYFQDDKGGSCGCMNQLSPYAKWCNSSTEDDAKKYAKEFVDWLKEHLEV